MTHKQPTILFFVRWPEPGRVKSRLAATLGAEQACSIHSHLATCCFAQAMATADSQVIVCGTGAEPKSFRSWLPGASDYWQQPEGGLGERLEAMFAAAFAQGASRIAATGSDAPLLLTSSIEGALDSLTNHDVCLLPAADGGYVLIGCTRLHPCLFREMPWSKADLLSRTLEVCAANGLRVHIGSTHQDVDTEADWIAVRALLPILQSPHPHLGESS